MSELARILAAALAADVREYPDGPPAEVSVTSGPGSNRLTVAPIVTGKLHPPAADCGRLRVLSSGGPV